MLKTPSVLLTKDLFGLLTWGTSPFATAPTSLSSACSRLQDRRIRPRQRQHRTYATIAADDFTQPTSKLSSSSDLPWPTSLHPTQPPSPYQIFNQDRGTPYSKRRFYELVMKYHPDRNSHPDESPDTSPNPCKCTKEVMLDRYRLVIAANNILSDPEKRAAYDKFGVGWNNKVDSMTESPLHKYSTYHRWRKTAQGDDTVFRWPHEQDPMYNATWEDWERWYEAQRDKARASSSMPLYGHFFTSGRGTQRKAGIFMNNYAFVSIVFLFALLGGIGQATRAHDYSKSIQARAQELNDQTSQVLMRARQDTIDQSTVGESKKDRIRRFIASVEGEEQSVFEPRSSIPGIDQDVCAPGSIKDRDQPRYWEKPPERDEE